MSFTLSFTSKSSIICVDYFPTIELTDRYELALLNFETYNSIPNIDDTNNKLYYNNNQIITIPTGSYEIRDIEEYIITALNQEETIKNTDFTFSLRGNRTTLKCEISSSLTIDFTKPNNIGQILGFKDIVLDANKTYESNRPINIFKVSTVRIVTNITSGAYINNKLEHCIYEFSPNVSPGYKISLTPNNLIYFPVNVQKIDHIEIKICDQNNEIINFRDELISLRLHLKPIK